MKLPSAAMLDDRTREAVGHRLRLTRIALGYDQGVFATEAGLSASAYNQYETGRKLPSVAAASALVDRYGLTLDWIFLGDANNLRYELASSIHALQTSRNLR